MLHQEHDFSDLFVAYQVDRHSRTQADLVDQLFNSSEKRLARALLILARFGKNDRPEAVIPEIKQDILAEMIGTTHSRVNFFMNRFRRLGYIDYNGGLKVHSSLLNVVLHDQFGISRRGVTSLFLLKSQRQVHIAKTCSIEDRRGSAFSQNVRPGIGFLLQSRGRRQFSGDQHLQQNGAVANAAGDAEDRV